MNEMRVIINNKFHATGPERTLFSYRKYIEEKRDLFPARRLRSEWTDQEWQDAQRLRSEGMSYKDIGVELHKLHPHENGQRNGKSVKNKFFSKPSQA